MMQPPSFRGQVGHKRNNDLDKVVKSPVIPLFIFQLLIFFLLLFLQFVFNHFLIFVIFIPLPFMLF